MYLFLSKYESSMNYTDYLQKAGIKKEKRIKGWFEDYKRLVKVVPSENQFNKGVLFGSKNRGIIKAMSER